MQVELFNPIPKPQLILLLDSVENWVINIDNGTRIIRFKGTEAEAEEVRSFQEFISKSKVSKSLCNSEIIRVTKDKNK